MAAGDLMTRALEALGDDGPLSVEALFDPVTSPARRTQLMAVLPSPANPFTPDAIVNRPCSCSAGQPSSTSRLSRARIPSTWPRTSC